jgi:quercetin dioxygenase-like cupin family protein
VEAGLLGVPGGSQAKAAARDNATPLPRILISTTKLAAKTGEPDVSGALWKLEIRDRDLDSNIVAIPPDGVIDTHIGPDRDVLIHVLAGSGTLEMSGTLEIEPGTLAWLLRRSMREFSAGPAGLRYLTVHKRRQALVLNPSTRPVR